MFEKIVEWFKGTRRHEPAENRLVKAQLRSKEVRLAVLDQYYQVITRGQK